MRWLPSRRPSPMGQRCTRRWLCAFSTPDRSAHGFRPAATLSEPDPELRHGRGGRGDFAIDQHLEALQHVPDLVVRAIEVIDPGNDLAVQQDAVGGKPRQHSRRCQRVDEQGTIGEPTRDGGVETGVPVNMACSLPSGRANKGAGRQTGRISHSLAVDCGTEAR